MIISHTHRYVFIEIPLTASWAIHRELCKYYDGTPILNKHSSYSEFRRQATPDERNYFAFATVRHPLDRVVSSYFKLRTDHKGAYSNSESISNLKIDYPDEKKFRFVTSTDATFGEFFRRYYKLPYGDMLDISSNDLDFVIRYERLQEDFSDVLRQLGMQQVRPLPVRNKTHGKRDTWQSYYTPDIQEQTKKIFGPYMQKWGYEFPSEWGKVQVSWIDQAKFHLVVRLRNFYLDRLRYNNSYYTRVLRRLRAHMMP